MTHARVGLQRFSNDIAASQCSNQHWLMILRHIFLLLLSWKCKAFTVLLYHPGLRIDPLSLRRLNRALLHPRLMTVWSKRGNVNTAAPVTILLRNTPVARCTRQLIGRLGFCHTGTQEAVAIVTPTCFRCFDGRPDIKPLLTRCNTQPLGSICLISALGLDRIIITNTKWC